jgi:hypothetical protein
MIPNDALKPLLQIGLKDRKRMTILIAFLVVCSVGIGSIYFLGSGNEVEEDAEEVAKDMIEYELHIPSGEIEQIDAGMKKLEESHKKSKIDNS